MPQRGEDKRHARPPRRQVQPERERLPSHKDVVNQAGAVDHAGQLGCQQASHQAGRRTLWQVIDRRQRRHQPSRARRPAGQCADGTAVDEVILLLVANTLDQEPEPVGAIAGDHGDDIDREPGGNLREQPARVLLRAPDGGVIAKTNQAHLR